MTSPANTNGASEAQDLEALRALLAAAARRALADLSAPLGAPHPRSVWKAMRDACASLEVDTSSPNVAFDPAGVLALWKAEGPLIHESTGFQGLDDATGGGPVYGARWYILGAPDAGKTAVLVQQAHELALRGIAVGLLAVDEEPSDVLTRLAQRVGFDRIACEKREHGALEAMGRHLAGLPLRMYGPGWTIERAAADLASFASKRGVRAMLGIDSIQTVKCDLETMAERELSEVQAIGLRVQAIRAVATAHRLIAIATSEMSRAAYRSIAKADRIDPLAAGKWSGAIEYSARVILSLRNVKGAPDTIEVELPKNKHGRRRYASEGEALYLEIDRARQTLREIEAPAEESEGEDEGAREAREAARDAKAEALAERILAALVRANAKGVRITSREDLRGLVKGGNDLKARAVSFLIGSGRIEGGNRKPYVPRYQDSEAAE